MQRSATFGYRLTTTLYGTKATRDTFSKVRFTVKKFHVERVNFIPLRVNNSSINQQYMYTYPRNQFSYTELFHLLSNLSFLFSPPPFYISIFAQSFVLIIFSRTPPPPLCPCIPSSRPFSSFLGSTRKVCKRKRKGLLKKTCIYIYIIKGKREGGDCNSSHVPTSFQGSGRGCNRTRHS